MSILSAVHALFLLCKLRRKTLILQVQRVHFVVPQRSPPHPDKPARANEQTDMNEFLETEEQVLKMLKTVFDPEIPVNIYDLGLIYRIDLPGDGVCNIDMTLTAPGCPAADFLVEDIKQKVGSVDGIKTVNVNIVFEPEWNKDMMSEEAKLELGFM